MTTHRKLAIIFAVLLVGSFLPALLFSKHPAAVVAPALQKLANDTSFFAAATIGMVAPASVIESAGVDVAAIPAVPLIFVGEGGMNLPKNQPPSGRASFTMGGTDEKRLTIEMVAAQDGSSYARLTNVPADEGEGSEIIRAVEGQWFSMPSRTLASMVAGEGVKSVVPAQGASGSRPAATWQGVRDQLAGGDMFGVPVALGFAGLSSVTVRHYQLPVMAQALVPFAQDLKSLQLGRALTADELKAVADKALNTSVRLEVWVDVRSEELKQAKLTIGSRDPGNKAENLREFSALIKFTAWDVPVETTLPPESRPFNELVKPAPAPTPAQ